MDAVPLGIWLGHLSHEQAFPYSKYRLSLFCSMWPRLSAFFFSRVAVQAQARGRTHAGWYPSPADKKDFL